MGSSGRLVCSKCGKDKRLEDFFKLKDGTPYDMCKSCLTMFVNNRDPQTFLWILEKFDVPYIEDAWIKLTNKIYAKDPTKFNSGSVIGQYLRTMKMTQYHDLHFSDTERLKQEALDRQKVAAEKRNQKAGLSDDELRERLEKGEITEAEFKTLSANIGSSTVAFDERIQQTGEASAEPAEDESQKYLGISAISEEDILKQLTEEDIQYLTLKWGHLYKPSQWVKMEELYQKYANEYELNVDREATLKMICKTQLKMDEALDAGDYTAYKNLASANDTARKSAKFTESQNKEETQTAFLDSIGELVRLCEQEKGIIPQYVDYESEPQDKIDLIIKDMQSYTYNLVKNEQGLGDLIESYIKKLEEAQEAKNEDLSYGLATNIDEEMANAATDEDYEDFQDFLDEEEQRDLDLVAEKEQEAEELLSSIGRSD